MVAVTARDPHDEGARARPQLFIDRFKFRGINVKHRVGEVKSLVNAYSWEVREARARRRERERARDGRPQCE